MGCFFTWLHKRVSLSSGFTVRKASLTDAWSRVALFEMSKRIKLKSCPASFELDRKEWYRLIAQARVVFPSRNASTVLSLINCCRSAMVGSKSAGFCFFSADSFGVNPVTGIPKGGPCFTSGVVTPPVSTVTGELEGEGCLG